MAPALLIHEMLIPSEPAEVLSTDRRVTCSIEPIAAAALIAIRCRTSPIPIDPIAINTVRIPSNASVRSRGSSRRDQIIEPHAPRNQAIWRVFSEAPCARLRAESATRCTGPPGGGNGVMGVMSV
jgi:hypothetical protein